MRSPAQARAVAAVAAASFLLSAAAVPADALPSTKASLTVHVWHLRDNHGKVGCALFGSAKGFPRDMGAASQLTWCAIDEKEALCTFDPVPPGTFSVACFHDENGNGKLNKNLLGIPTEGVAVSNDAKGTFGPPSFDDAKFALPAGPTELRLQTQYF